MRYLRGLDPDATRHDDMPIILGAANTLSQAPAAFADYALGAFKGAHHRRNGRVQPTPCRPYWSYKLDNAA